LCHPPRRTRLEALRVLVRGGESRSWRQRRQAAGRHGKGPVKAKSFLIDDTVICVLEGGFTIVERTLIDAGEEGAVHNIRNRFQSVMKSQFSGVVEEMLGREVRAYMSQVHTDPDVAVEMFMLEPTGEPIVAEHALEFPPEG
jgi:uncharacterized protein YbcI